MECVKTSDRLPDIKDMYYCKTKSGIKDKQLREDAEWLEFCYNTLTPELENKICNHNGCDGILEIIHGDGHYNIDYYQCNKCDSTYNVFELIKEL